MECKDILNLIAIVIRIVAVLIGQHLQNRAEICRKLYMMIKQILIEYDHH